MCGRVMIAGHDWVPFSFQLSSQPKDPSCFKKTKTNKHNVINCIDFLELQNNVTDSVLIEQQLSHCPIISMNAKISHPDGKSNLCMG